MRTKWRQSLWGISLLLSAGLFGCSGTVDKQIEMAQFLLDDGKFEEAAVEARKAVEADPTSVEANFVLSSALLGQAILGSEPRCAPSDAYPLGTQGYLGFIACLQDEQSGDETGTETFVRIAPDTTAGLETLEDATNILISTTGLSLGNRERDVYLQLYVARLFEIAGAISRIGANTDDEACNADGDTTKTDGLPDSFNPGALSAVQSERFRDNVENVNSDGERAGLPDDFELNGRLLDMTVNLSQAISDAGGDTQAGTAAFFNDEFGLGSAICVPK